MKKSVQYTCPDCGQVGAHPEDSHPPLCHGCGYKVRMKRSRNGKILESKKKFFKLNGVLETKSDDVTMAEVIDKFLAWVEGEGWFFGGGISPVDTDVKEEDVKKCHRYYEETDK